MTRNTDEFENLMQGEALAVKQLKSSDSHQKKKNCLKFCEKRNKHTTAKLKIQTMEMKMQDIVIQKRSNVKMNFFFFI